MLLPAPRPSLQAIFVAIFLLVAGPGRGHAQDEPPGWRPWQLGLALTPGSFRLARVTIDAPVEDNKEDRFEFLPAEFEIVGSHAVTDWLAGGLRFAFGHHRSRAEIHESLGLRLGPLLRAMPWTDPEWRTTVEVGAAYMLARDGFQSLPDLFDPMPQQQVVVTGHGVALLLQVGGQVRASDFVSVDGGVRAEYQHYAGEHALTGDVFQVSLVLGMSIWLGDSPLDTRHRQPSPEVRDLFRPTDVPAEAAPQRR